MGEWIGHVVDVPGRTIRPARVTWNKGVITSIENTTVPPGATFLVPGFIDAHIHIESSMVPPREFARLALPHGTVATVSDPHEIANVLGEEGVDFMLEEARGVPLGFLFGAPSCVPATAFETAGAELDAEAVGRLLSRPDVGYLAEVMNFPGVIARDPGLMEKIRLAREAGKPVDGHAPGLRGEGLREYVAAGIATDHECSVLEEAVEKIAHGMKILIREGSAARNFEALESLLSSDPAACMLCSDDKHPDELLTGHIDRVVAESVARGHDVFSVLQAACIHPALHYGLPRAFLREGDPATFLVVENLDDFRVRETWIDGEIVAREGRCLLPFQPVRGPNRFVCDPVRPSDLTLPPRRTIARVIDVEDGQLLTRQELLNASNLDGVIKLAVVNRYRTAPPAVALVRGLGLQRGAIASTVAHDCHNIIAAGCDDESLARAINAVISSRGGCAVCDGSSVSVLPLPIAGLMSDQPGQDVATAYTDLTRRARALGSPLAAPFMTLSFLALLVIPELKLSDKGLFDGRAFEFVPLFE